MVGLTPVIVTAHVYTGVAADPRAGIAFDGLLAGRLRRRTEVRASQMDGGMSADVPLCWPVPLQRCGDGDDWHWQASSGWLVDVSGNPLPWEPEVHQIAQTVATGRMEQVVGVLPESVSRSRRRFRDRLTHIVTFPCAAVVWRAVGDPEQIESLLCEVTSVGARRGAGEGAVRRWQVETVDEAEVERFAHVHPDGSQGRPLPQRCITRFGLPPGEVGVGGIRPPVFHPGTQQHLVYPPRR